jgi:hypothetical protein
VKLKRCCHIHQELINQRIAVTGQVTEVAGAESDDNLATSFVICTLQQILLDDKIKDGDWEGI